MSETLPTGTPRWSLIRAIRLLGYLSQLGRALEFVEEGTLVGVFFSMHEVPLAHLAGFASPRCGVCNGCYIS